MEGGFYLCLVWGWDLIYIFISLVDLYIFMVRWFWCCVVISSFFIVVFIVCIL